MKRSLFTAGGIALALVALIVAGSAVVLAQRGSSPSTCAPNALKCPSGPEGPSAKGTSIAGSPEVPSPEVPSAEGTITSINGSTVTVQAKDRTSTIHLTVTTTFQKLTPPKQLSPASQADLAVGEVIQAQGTLNSDGSLQATVVTILVTG